MYGFAAESHQIVLESLTLILWLSEDLLLNQRCFKNLLGQRTLTVNPAFLQKVMRPFSTLQELLNDSLGWSWRFKSRQAFHLLQAQNTFYKEPAVGCSSQAMQGHALAFPFAILKISPNQHAWIHSADPMHTILLLLICYCIGLLISKITILRWHVNLNGSLINNEPQLLHSCGSSSKLPGYWLLCEPAANISPWRKTYIKPLSGDCKTCFAQGLPREGSNATENELYVENNLLSPSWAISSSSASVFAAAIAWGNFRVNGRTSLLLKTKIIMVFATTSILLKAFVFSTGSGWAPILIFFLSYGR